MGSVILSTFPQLSLLKGEKTNLTYTLLIYNKFRNKLSKIIDTFRVSWFPDRLASQPALEDLQDEGWRAQQKER